MARFVRNGFFTDGNGNVVDAGTVSVVLAGTSTVATIYAAASGGSAISGGKVTTGSNGFFTFYVDEGDYASTQLFDITLSKTGLSSKTLENERLILFLGALDSPTFAGITSTGDGLFTGNLTIRKTNPQIILDADGGTPIIDFQRAGVIDCRLLTTNVNQLTIADNVGAFRVQWDVSTNPGTLTMGSIPDARLTSNVALLDASTNTFTGGLTLSSTTQPFKPPSMTTTQRDAIASPTAGMVIYNSTTNVLNFHNGTSWGAV
ncbi:MAG: hypothetical protein ACE5DX_05630 [Candidatus Dojkabacteria bacterium]